MEEEAFLPPFVPQCDGLVFPWSMGLLAVRTETSAHVRMLEPKCHRFTDTNLSFSPFTNFPYFPGKKK